MSVPLIHARQLREVHRHEEAVAMLTQALASEPENPWLFEELALNRLSLPEQREKGLEDINRAIALDPGTAPI
jgi:tetratricopeptide (TPR) repeat protein